MNNEHQFGEPRAFLPPSYAPIEPKSNDTLFNYKSDDFSISIVDSLIKTNDINGETKYSFVDEKYIEFKSDSVYSSGQVINFIEKSKSSYCYNKKTRQLTVLTIREKQGVDISYFRCDYWNRDTVCYETRFIEQQLEIDPTFLQFNSEYLPMTLLPENKQKELLQKKDAYKDALPLKSNERIIINDSISPITNERKYFYTK